MAHCDSACPSVLLIQGPQEVTIRAQHAAVVGISTPLVPISECVMVMPLIGSIESQCAQQVLDALLYSILDNSAQVAILEITGVRMVNGQVANALVPAARSVKPLGARSDKLAASRRVRRSSRPPAPRSGRDPARQQYGGRASRRGRYARDCRSTPPPPQATAR